MYLHSYFYQQSGDSSLQNLSSLFCFVCSKTRTYVVFVYWATIIFCFDLCLFISEMKATRRNNVLFIQLFIRYLLAIRKTGVHFCLSVKLPVIKLSTPSTARFVPIKNPLTRYLIHMITTYK